MAGIVYVGNAADKHADVMSFTTNDSSRVQYSQISRRGGHDLRHNFRPFGDCRLYLQLCVKYNENVQGPPLIKKRRSVFAEYFWKMLHQEHVLLASSCSG
ncbi:TonB-dependent receptor [Komagataeibacter xylinus E25]|nr:TonB-dependent receptor [Komagataeibacter xylinus E25]